jgi:pyruvate formate lyase activating enzyme
MRREYELSWFDMRCIGIEKCGKCLDACPEGAISAGTPVNAPMATESGEAEKITKVNIDRGKCTACLACAEACPTKALAPSGYEMTVDDVYERVARDRMFFADGGGATISGGEPMAQFDFTYALARKFADEDITVAIDTTGFAQGELYEKITPYTNLFLYDLKHMDSENHRKLTGIPNELILENAERIAKSGGKFQIRMPVIPKLNDGEENIRAAAQFAKSLGDAVVEVQLLPYHKLGASKYTRIGREYPLRNVEAPSDETMQGYLELVQSFGLAAKIH